MNPIMFSCCVGLTSYDFYVQDIVSYNLEQARGDASHNIVTIVMNELNTDVSGAMRWIADFHKRLEKQFFEAFKNIPKTGNATLDAQIATYCDGLGNWVRANDQWSFESERYFGRKGLEIMKTRVISLMPVRRTEALGPQLVDDSAL